MYLGGDSPLFCLKMKHKKMNRDHFMAFFRNDEKLNTLSSEDRMEVFLQILHYAKTWPARCLSLPIPGRAARRQVPLIS